MELLELENPWCCVLPPLPLMLAVEARPRPFPDPFFPLPCKVCKMRLRVLLEMHQSVVHKRVLTQPHKIKAHSVSRQSHPRLSKTEKMAVTKPTQKENSITSHIDTANVDSFPVRILRSQGLIGLKCVRRDGRL